MQKPPLARLAWNDLAPAKGVSLLIQRNVRSHSEAPAKPPGDCRTAVTPAPEAMEGKPLMLPQLALGSFKPLMREETVIKVVLLHAG